MVNNKKINSPIMAPDYDCKEQTDMEEEKVSDTHILAFHLLKWKMKDVKNRIGQTPWNALALASGIFSWESHKHLGLAQHSHIYHDVGLYSTGRKKWLEKPFEMFLAPKPCMKHRGSRCSMCFDWRATEKLRRSLNLQRPWIRIKQPPRVRTFWRRISDLYKML